MRLSWLLAILGVAAAGCAGTVTPVASVSCKQPRSFAKAPLPQEVGVYRAGPLLLFTGDDLAQLPRGQIRQGSGVDAIAVVRSNRTVTLSVDRTAAVDGNSLSGCPVAPATPQLGESNAPFLGVACGTPNSIACDRVGVGVNVDAATLVMVEVAGRLVTLSPPTDAPNDHLWLGYLYGAGLRHGPLDVHISPHATRWFGDPEVQPPVAVEVFFDDGTVARLTGRGFLHAGFG